ncbi:hypothetical protein D0463_17215 [Bacillus sp. V59.32b]|nr:hypothetical protein D0463_17215 [Bacillus sp. V59.32b]
MIALFLLFLLWLFLAHRHGFTSSQLGPLIIYVIGVCILTAGTLFFGIFYVLPFIVLGFGLMVVALLIGIVAWLFNRK